MALDNWVSDKLYEILGYREKSLSTYVIALGMYHYTIYIINLMIFYWYFTYLLINKAKKAKDSKALLDELSEQEVPITAATQQFAKDLYSKIPRAVASQVYI